VSDALTRQHALRPAATRTRTASSRLIGDAWSEYPGCILDVDGELPELRALATHFARLGRCRLGGGGGSGCPRRDGRDPAAERRPAWEIAKMYVAKGHRGTGLAHALIGAAETHAVAQGAHRMILWTDTRFEAAHRFYEKRGYVRSGSIRILDDVSKSLEFRYAKPAVGLVVDMLDAAAAASAERRLAEILVACVDGGGVGRPSCRRCRSTRRGASGAASRRAWRPARRCSSSRGATGRSRVRRSWCWPTNPTGRTAPRSRRCWWIRPTAAAASGAL
jgi:GNAT superfamily N-acetyltransferase